MITNEKLKSLNAYFTTTKIGNLRVESDGCAGTGYTHWRAVYVGKKLVAALESPRHGREVTVTIAKRGNLRGVGEGETFANMKAAAEFLITKFNPKSKKESTMKNTNKSSALVIDPRGAGLLKAVKVAEAEYNVAFNKWVTLDEASEAVLSRKWDALDKKLDVLDAAHEKQVRALEKKIDAMTKAHEKKIRATRKELEKKLYKEETSFRGDAKIKAADKATNVAFKKLQDAKDKAVRAGVLAKPVAKKGKRMPPKSGGRSGGSYSKGGR